ncbi:MAG TPA: SRPBCC family protein [Thermoleophilaceae bacterium]|nr:SRPBCC family protein [Thermoleophilaceae bacterium]
MAKDVVADVVGIALGRVAREAVQTVSSNARKKSSGPLNGTKGVAAGIGLAALAPVAAKGAGKLVRGISSGGGELGEKLSGSVKDAVSDKVPNPGNIAKQAGKAVLPGGGGGGKGKSKGMPGVGKGRRMPIQQDIDIGVPLGTVYNQFTQFEEWPNFMHRVDRVSQEDESHVSFKAKIWGISKEFKAEIVEQRPDERIKWKVTDGLTHTGVVTFHELGPRLTRVELNLDVQPDSMIEKAARGMRHVKRAVRADLARFKAYVLMEEEESGAWRGEIEDGDVKKRSSARRSGGGGSSSRRSSASGRSSSRRSTSARGRSSTNGSSGSSSARGRSSSGGSSRGRAKASSSNGRSGSSRSKSGSRS